MYLAHRRLNAPCLQALAGLCTWLGHSNLAITRGLGSIDPNHVISEQHYKIHQWHAGRVTTSSSEHGVHFNSLICQFEVGSHGYPTLYPNPRYSKQRYNEVGVYTSLPIHTSLCYIYIRVEPHSIVQVTVLGWQNLLVVGWFLRKVSMSWSTGPSAFRNLKFLSFIQNYTTLRVNTPTAWSIPPWA